MSKLQKPLCEISGCRNARIYWKTINPYCEMHKARLKRNGHFELKPLDFSHLEKLPHAVDSFILDHTHKLMDKQIARRLRLQGYAGASVWTVRYRR